MRILSRSLSFGLPVLIAGKSFESETYHYAVCNTIGEGSSAIVYKAHMQKRSAEQIDHKPICLADNSPDLVALKCTPKNVEEAEDFDIQIEYSKKLEEGGSKWGVKTYEGFKISETQKCLSMELLGQSIRDIREQAMAPFSITTLASLGLQMLEIVEEMHNKFELHHSDVHAFNWVVRRNNPRKLSLIDYGYMAPLTNTQERIDELKEMIITLRYLVDLNKQFYVPKRISTNDIGIICPSQVIPSKLAAIVAHIYRLNETGFDHETGYNIIKQMFLDILTAEGVSYNNEIIWGTRELAIAQAHVEDLDKVKQRRKKLQRQGDTGGNSMLRSLDGGIPKTVVATLLVYIIAIGF
jgi:serine/threonine protein kinase